jgi:hypothetical protein
MNARERSQAIIEDILTNHLPRIKEGLEKGYVDENQILVVYDHAVRARVLQEYDFEADAKRISDALARNLALRASHGKPAHVDALDEINRELAAEIGVKEVKGTFVGSPKKVGGVPVPSPLRGESLTCACGGLVKEFPASPEFLLKCERCERVYMDEDEVTKVQRTEQITGQKCVDATYFTTGTLAGGTNPVAMETEINLNGRKMVIKAKDGRFVLTYEEIVRMAVNQRKAHCNAFTGPDADLPHETVTYSHRVEFARLPGERTGSLWKGKSVAVTPGMVINCIDTSHA